MAVFLSNTQGVQYNDVTDGNFTTVSQAVINHDTLIVRDTPEGGILDAASFFESASASFSSVFKGSSDQKERVVAALNSFYTERHQELYTLTPSQIQGLFDGLRHLQQEMNASPSFRDSGISYIIDVSKKDHAAREETQRAVRADFCLSDALASVRKALDEINSEPRMTEDEGFLLIADEENETLQDQSMPPKADCAEDAARLKAIFSQNSVSDDDDVDFRQK
jgi:hypothetical protein